jgi:hypothetical protein
VPFDDGLDRFDQLHLQDPLVLQGRAQGVAQSEPADEYVQVPTGVADTSETQMRQLLLDQREEARHQELVVDLHFVDVVANDRLLATAQADHPDRGVGGVELFDAQSHLGLRHDRRPHP